MSEPKRTNHWTWGGRSTANEYRDEAQKWDRIAIAAELDGDAFWVGDARREAAALRQCARILEAS